MEWLEPDGLGGFASGTTDRIRTRRYHALLLSADPSTHAAGFARFALVNDVEVALVLADGTNGGTNGTRIALSSQRYTPDVVFPDGSRRISAFTREPWPRWTYAIDELTAEVTLEVIGVRGAPVVALAWRSTRGTLPGGTRLLVRPLLSGRDIHATHHENGAFRFDAEGGGGLWTWHPYEPLPRIVALTNGEYRHDPVWFRNFQYDEERERGLDFVEDLASPGEFSFDLARGEAALVLATASTESDALLGDASAERAMKAIRSRERLRRSRFTSTIERSADDFLVRRRTASGSVRTIIAGYPWFTDWGRDTFIALRGLCIASGRLNDARDILLEWTRYVSQGMLPNYFPEQGREPEYNSVDASLWFVIAAHDFLRASERRARTVTRRDRGALVDAMRAIIEGYAAGTRFGIRADDDGLLAAGTEGYQLTWMDAKVGDRVITPRVGKPVEVEALWINALEIADAFGVASPELRDMARRARAAFGERFWNAERGCLFDVVDVNHERGTADASLRPNQLFAVGGLPYPLIDGDRARAIVDAVEAALLTPLGPRTLAPGEPGYRPRCTGGPAERDAAYHQGTVWPWLVAPLVDAWLATRRGPELDTMRDEAHRRFIAPLVAHLDDAGLGHVSEIADAEPPFTPRGCPFQAWSLGALAAAMATLRREQGPEVTSQGTSRV